MQSDGYLGMIYKYFYSSNYGNYIIPSKKSKYYCSGKAFMEQCRTEVFYFLQHKTRFHASENYFSLWKNML